MRIGVHLSIGNGFLSALEDAKRLGCEAVQIFVKNPRSWTGKDYKKADIESMKKLIGFCPVFAHLSYLPNLARIDEDERNLTGFLLEARLCHDLGIKSLVAHCGSNKEKMAGIESVAAAVDAALDQYGLTILLENSAGQGMSIGSTIEDLSAIYDRIHAKDRVFLCLDTSHLFQAGYDIRSKEVWDGTMSLVEDIVGPGKIGLLHLNDSKTGLASNVDRHWHIGQGFIGEEAFLNILHDQKFAHLCGVLETPKMGNMDEQNLRTVRRLSATLMPRSSS